jgi:eukaryotic-like serine/threonine-protein kinase
LDAIAEVEAHVVTCASCRDLLSFALHAAASLQGSVAVGAGTDTVAASPGTVATDDRGPLRRGAGIGRYTVLEMVGRGGMGEVYAAYDPELDRKIALKLLRTNEHAADPIARARLLREAKAIAKLSHPNVVAVHDAGTFQDRVFIAMEFVDGSTVKDWQSERPRTRAEILAVFKGAAHGLAAAHGVGLVHRDFKPQNVMVAKGGGVRVMDFGLARQIGAADAPAEELATSGSWVTDADLTDAAALKLTQTGVMVGTPAYMAPEQFALEPTDARTDQFSFCVALYESLYGQRPFAGETVVAVMTAVVSGSVSEASPGSRVPAWLRRLLLRGLQKDPARRFPSMTALLAALEADPTVRRRRFALGAAGVLCLAGVALGVRHVSRPAEALCEGGAQRWIEVWQPAGAPSPRKEQIRRAFAATGKSYAEQAFQGAARLLDEYVGRWLGMYRDTCEATHVRGEQSAEVLDLRMGCLQERLTSVRALTNVFTTADGNTVENAATAAGALPNLDRCADVPVLKAVIQPPQDEATRKRVDVLRGERARLVALRDSGHCVDAKALASLLIKQTRASGYLPLLAETLSSAGIMYNECVAASQSVEWFQEAFAAAVESHDDEAAAESATLLTSALAERSHKGEEARSWLRIAQASLHRLGSRPVLESWWLVSEGYILEGEGRYAEAIAAQRRALATKEKVLGPEHPDVLISRLDVALGLQMNGELDEAFAELASLMKVAVRTLGPEHPFLGKPLNNQGEVLNALGRFAEARGAFRRALDVFQKAGSDAELLSYPLTGLGLATLGEGHPAQAIAPLEEALKIRLERKDAPELVGEARFALARALGSNPSERKRALLLARAARDDYARAKANAKIVATIDAWLKAPPKPVGP